MFKANSLRGAFTAFLGVCTELCPREHVLDRLADGPRTNPPVDEATSLVTNLTRKCGSIDMRARIVKIT